MQVLLSLHLVFEVSILNLPVFIITITIEYSNTHKAKTKETSFCTEPVNYN